MRITSRPEISCSSKVNSGAVSPMTQLRERSNRMRNTSPIPSPRRRASACRSSGSLSTSMEIKTTLSMPRTISRASKVRKATQISGFSNRSMSPTLSSNFVPRGGSVCPYPSLRQITPRLVHGVGDFHLLTAQKGSSCDHEGRDGGGEEQERSYQDGPVGY